MDAQFAAVGSVHRYRWGWLFVRSATVCAIACFAIGCGVAALQLARLRAAWVATANRSAAEFSGDLEALRESCRRAAEVVQAGFGVGAVPAPPAAAFPDAIRTSRDLAGARAALEAYERYVGDLKAGMLTSFSESSDWLVGSMTRKAEKIRQKLEEEHSGEAADLQARIEQLRHQLEGGGSGLYETLDQAEVQRRMDILDQAGAFLQVLGGLGGGEAAQARIAVATQAIERLRALIPEPSPEGRRLRLVRQVAELRRALSDLLKDGHKLEGEELAGRLQVIQMEVAAATQSSWTVDTTLRRLRDRLNAAAVTLAAAEQERSRLWRWGLAKAGGVLLAALGAALLMRVLADVLSALLDTAEALQCQRAGGSAPDGSGSAPAAIPPPPARPAAPGTKPRHYLRDE